MTSDAYLGSVPGCIIVGENLEVDKSTLNYLGAIPLPLTAICARGDLISAAIDTPPGEVPTPLALPLGKEGQNLAVACTETPTGLCWGYIPTIGSAVSRFDWDEKGSLAVGTGCPAGDAPPYQPTALSLNPGNVAQFLRVNPEAPQCLCWETNPYYGVFTERGQFLSSDCCGNVAIVPSGQPNFILYYNDVCRLTGWSPSCGKVDFVPQLTEKAALFVGADLDYAICFYPVGAQQDCHCLFDNYKCPVGVNWVCTPEAPYFNTWNYDDGNFEGACLYYCLVDGSCFPEGCAVFSSVTVTVWSWGQLWPYKDCITCFGFQQGYDYSDPIALRWCDNTGRDNTQCSVWQLSYLVTCWNAACPLIMMMPDLPYATNTFATSSFALHK